MSLFNRATGALAAIVLAIVLGFAGAADAKGERMEFKKLDKEVARAILMAMSKQGLGKEQPAQVAISTGDCPSSCGDSTLGGMCYCAPDKEGKCPSGTTSTTRGGKPACKIKPTTASIWKDVGGRGEEIRVQGVNDY